MNSTKRAYLLNKLEKLRFTLHFTDLVIEKIEAGSGLFSKKHEKLLDYYYRLHKKYTNITIALYGRMKSE